MQEMVNLMMDDIVKKQKKSSIITLVILKDLIFKIDEISKIILDNYYLKLLKQKINNLCSNTICIGFNSSQYDAILLEPFIEKYCFNNSSTVNLPTTFCKGNSVLSLKIKTIWGGFIIFKDFKKMIPPGKSLSNLCDMYGINEELSKMTFPHSLGTSVANLKKTSNFPETSKEWYNMLKDSAICEQEIKEAVRVYKKSKSPNLYR